MADEQQQQTVSPDTICKEPEQLQQEQQKQQSQQQQQKQQQQQPQQQLQPQLQQQQQNEYDLETFQTRITNCTQYEERGYAVVPASVSFKGVSMQLDLKIDQKTLAAATNISKAVEQAVSSHLAFSGGVVPLESTDLSGSSPQSQSMPAGCGGWSYHRNQFSSVAESSARTSTTTNTTTIQSPVACDSSVESSSTSFMVFIFAESNPNELAATPLEVSGMDSSTESTSSMKRPSSSSYASTEYGVLDECFRPSTSSFAATASGASVATTAPSAAAPRKDRSGASSRFCEFSDPEKGQCRQRAIIEYRYCIRHILLDPTAPYIQCQHARKPKSRHDTNLRCTNAIRKDENRSFCKTHMIMNGLMEPKKRKQKRPDATVEVEEQDGSQWGNGPVEQPKRPLVLNTLDELQSKCFSDILIHYFLKREAKKCFKGT
ncbi:unnamed protein product [Gongylonema pulchrum]|uniref:Zf-C3Hc3H domain-containing protein n=1 Tax=Gongylonema pulchrum TaxID=637853 RepID=A0A183E1A6_9BILA|nr:unnamed protein product [Gongylonema pulchrum]